MAQEFLVPALGDSIAEVEIVEWLVDVGDSVEQDQTVVVVETDKSVVDVPCPFAGTVLSRGGDAGSVVEVGQVLLVVEGVGEETPIKEATAVFAVSNEPPAGAEARPAQPEPGPDLNPVQRMRTKALPKVRKLARDQGVILDSITPSGAGGEILPEDLVREPAPAAKSGGRTERMSRVRRTISERMTESWTQIPMMSGFFEAQGEAFFAARRALADQLGKRVPVEALLIPLLVPALREFPQLNATVDGDQITYHDRIDMGVAIDTPEGLLVPVIRDADQLSLTQIVDELDRLVTEATRRTLAPSELTGQTFTLSNLGAVGGSHGVSILPKGTVGFVSIGRGRPTVRLRNGAPVEIPMIPLSITADHRIVDGGPAARFMTRLVGNIENPILVFV